MRTCLKIRQCENECGNSDVVHMLWDYGPAELIIDGDLARSRSRPANVGRQETIWYYRIALAVGRVSNQFYLGAC